MPLLDHFHEPSNPRANWESFHHRWATVIADGLDRTLPKQYFARVEIHLGPQIAADVAEFEPDTAFGSNGSGGVALQTYSPPTATATIPGKFFDETEVQVRSQTGERLLAMIELLSPANKANPAARRAFAAKLMAYLSAGIGVIIVDAITHSHFNLHDELIDEMECSEALKMLPNTYIYANAYRPVFRERDAQVDAWLTPLEVGKPLPTLPLYLSGKGCIELNLEESYSETRQRIRLT